MKYLKLPKQYIPLLSYFCLIVIAVISFSKGFSGGFLFDDIANITLNDKVKISSLSFDSLSQAFNSAPVGNGILRRQISMLSLGINHHFSQLDAYYYKVINLVIHIVNSLSISLLITLLFSFFLADNRTVNNHKPSVKTTIFYISLFISSLWLFHPYNISTVLYIVQRMTSLSAFFVIWSLILYLKGRTYQLNQSLKKGWIYISVSFIFIIFGLLCKENAILTPIFFFLIEVFILKFQYKNNKGENNKKIIPLFFIVILALPSAIVLIYLALNPDFILSAYAQRHFTLYERVLTQFRILVIYLGQIILPNPQTMGFFSDDIELSKSIISPLTTLLSLLTIVFLLSVSWFYRNKYPLFAFGIFFFFSGHLLESSIIGLELSFEHRNYLPGLGIIIAITSLFIRPDSEGNTTVKVFKPAVPIFWLLFCLFVFYIRIDSWSSPFKLAYTQAINHPESSRSHYYIANQYFKHDNTEEFSHKALAHFEKSAQLDKTMIPGFMSQIFVYNKINQPVPETLIQKIEQRIKASTFFTVSTINGIYSLTNCLRIKNCNLDEDKYMRIINALLTNKHLINSHKGIILRNTSVYYGTVLNNHRKALFYSKLAVDTQPNASNWINYANWLANNQLFKQSLSALKKGKIVARSKYKQMEIEQSIKVIQPYLNKQMMENTKNN